MVRSMYLFCNLGLVFLTLMIVPNRIKIHGRRNKRERGLLPMLLCTTFLPVYAHCQKNPLLPFYMYREILRFANKMDSNRKETTSEYRREG